MMKTLRVLVLLMLLLPQLGMVAVRKAPAGMQQIPGLRNTFLDKVETTNQNWRFYLRQLRQTHGDTSKEYQHALPDLALWNLAYGKNFMDSTARPHHPVVGITYAQATKYCQWRSSYISGREHREVIFYLPGMREYKMAFNNGSANPIAEGLYSTGLGLRDFLGLCDNAAEMTAVEGTAINGHNQNGCLQSLAYTAPSHVIGFRCVAKVH